jgi:DtxR family Mn-dependent transcriptional regulator
MLSEVFGMEWYEIHAEAERLEHAVSPAFEARLIEKLGEQGTCPHGNTVLPESPAQRRKRGLIQLSESVENTDYLVTSLYERDPKLLVFLYQSGISPNTRIRLLTKNYDQTVAIETPLGSITLGRPAAERVWVKKISLRPGSKAS